MVDYNPKLKCIEQALYSYHYALDLHEDATVSARRTIDKIQEIMSKLWVPGAVLEERRRRLTWEPSDLVVVETKEDKRRS